MIGKKINQLATELAPDSTDLTIIGDPISGVSKKITLAQLGAIFSGAVGTVTSVAASITGDAIGITGSPITTSGTLALAFAGTSAQYINGAGNLTTFPTSLVSGSGASGQVTFFNGANSVTGTNNFFWDATNNRLGIGTTTPQRSIEIYNTTADNHLRLSGNAPSVSMGEAVTGSVYQAKFGLVTTNGQFVSAGVAGDFVIISQTGATIIGTSSTEKMRVNTSGNVSINNTNNTYKLDVTGTGRYTGQLRLESTITDGTNTYTLPSATGTLALVSQLTGGTVTSVGLSSATSGVTIGSSPITTSGTITLAIATASGSQQGLLSSTDWTTFNNKQNALTNPVTGTGTTNYLPKFTGTSTIGNSAIYDNGGNIGIGTTTTRSLSGYTFAAINGTTGGYLDVYSNGTIVGSLGAESSSFIITSQNTNGISFLTPLNTYSTKMFLSNSGNLGLGVTPSAWVDYKVLQFGGGSISSYTDNLFIEVNQNAFWNGSSYVYVNNGFASRYQQNVGRHEWYTAPSGTAGNAISFTQAMTLDASGRLGIGTTSPTEKLDVRGNIYTNATNTNIYLDNGGVGGASLKIGVTGSTSTYINSLDAHPLTFGTTNTERMRITSGGNVGIGTTSPACKLHIEAPAASYGLFRITSTSGSTGEASINYGRTDQAIDNRWTVGQGTDGIGNSFGFYSAGNKATLTTAGVWSTTGGGTSDLRTKKDIEYKFDNGIESLLKLQPTKFKFKSAPDKQRRGFIAQDVLQVIPDLVLGDGQLQGGTYGLDYDGILALAVKAIQELKAELDTLKNK